MKRVINDFNNNEIIINTIWEADADNLAVITKDINTGVKYLRSYKSPKIPVYILKYSPDQYLEFAKDEDVEEVWVPYRFREWAIAKALGHYNFAKDVKEKKLKAKEIFLDKRLFTADVHIEDIVMREYAKFCTNKETFVASYPVIKSFHLGGLDIETDIMVSDDRSEQPVIANTVIDNETWTVYTRCLINDEYKGLKEVMNDIPAFEKEFKKILYDHIENIDIDEDNPVTKKKKEDNIKEIIHEMADKLKLDLKFTNDEREVIAEPLKYVFNGINPDFLYIYNAVYDIEQMKLRANELKMDYDSLFQFRNEEVHNYFWYKDGNADPKLREHHYNSHNPTKILDQLLVYAHLRRAKNYPKYSLDATAKRELGVGKLDYSMHCNYIGDFPYVAYKEFLIYNIIDVFIMLCLDRITNDTYSQVYTRFNLCTEWGRIAKPLKRTTSVFDNFTNLLGYHPSNEVNSIFLGLRKKQLQGLEKADKDLFNVVSQLMEANVDDKQKNPYRIEGGCVTDPNKIKEEVKPNKIYNIPVKTFNKLENCADLDATSMYPSNTESNNASKTTFIGVMEAKEKNNKSRRMALSLVNENYSSIGEHFFNLPGAEELIRHFYKIGPKYKKRVETIDSFNQMESVDISLNFKPIDKLKKIYNKLYRTKFTDKDKDLGNASLSSYFFTNDSKEIELSYYSTKIKLILESSVYESFNDYNQMKGQGFICGVVRAKEKKILNHNEEYLKFMVPTKEYPELSECKVKGVITQDIKDNIASSKIHIYDLFLGNYKIQILDRLLFWNNSSEDLEYEIYDLTADENLSLLKLSTRYKLETNTWVKVEQHIIFYKI